MRSRLIVGSLNLQNQKVWCLAACNTVVTYTEPPVGTGENMQHLAGFMFLTLSAKHLTADELDIESHERLLTSAR